MKATCIIIMATMAILIGACSDNSQTRSTTNESKDSTQVKKDSTGKTKENTSEPGALNGQY
jgi:ABC-type enterochelin transport system substrate-binding protein